MLEARRNPRLQFEAGDSRRLGAEPGDPNPTPIHFCDTIGERRPNIGRPQYRLRCTAIQARQPEDVECLEVLPKPACDVLA